MRTLKFFTLILTVVSLINYSIEVVNVNTINCDFNPSACTGGYCKLLSPRGQMKYVSAGCFFPNPVNDITLKMTMLQKNGKDYKSIMKPVHQSLCDFSNPKAESYFFTRLMQDTAKKIGFKCPLKGNISQPRIPCFLHFTQGFYPLGDYILNVLVFNQEKHIVNMNLTFSINKNDFF